MGDMVNWAVSKNREYSSEKIVISPYCERKIAQRKIEEDLVRKCLTVNDCLVHVELQKNLFQGRW